MQAKKRKKKSLVKRLEPLFWLSPTLIMLCFFVYYPFAKTFVESFFSLNFMGEVKAFVGIENYVNVLTNAKFLQAIRNSIKFVIFTVPFSVGVSFVLAMIAAKKRPLSPLYETFFSLPMAMSMSVSAMIFQLMFNPTLGIVNNLLQLDIRWLNDRRTAMWVLIVIQVWMNIGFNFLFILSAIRGVSEDLIEASDLEGASTFKKATLIIIPLVSPTLFFLICNSLAKMVMMSGLTLVLTKGDPQGTTETMISFMYNQATGNSNYSTAYASAIVAFVITMAATLIAFLYEKKGVNYDT